MTRTKLLVAFPAVGVLITVQVPWAQDVEGDTLRPFLASESTSFLLDNARVVDGTGAVAREGLSLLIENGLIAKIGPSDEIAAPAGAERLDLAGHTVLPGLIMMHEHMDYSSGNGGPLSDDEVFDPHPNSIPKLLLAAGVTTARTAGSGTPQVDINLKRRIDSGAAVGPTLFVTGPYLNGPRGFRNAFLQDFVVETANEAREVVRFWVGQGATSVKMYENAGPDAMLGAIQEAHRLGAHVAGHLGMGTSCAQAAELGIDTIEHAFGSCLLDFGLWLDASGQLDLDERAADIAALIDTLVRHGVVLVTTPLDNPSLRPTDELLDEVLSMLSPHWRAIIEQRIEMQATEPVSIGFAGPLARALERDFVAAGGTLLIGADAGFGAVPGYANHARLIVLAETFAPLKVIKMATSDAAEFLGIDDRTGRIAAGLEADLLIVHGAPDIDMYDVLNVAYVFKDGRAFDPQRLRDASRGLVGLH
jgi:imidazolonepropionase-like amidohydrolase